MPTPKAKGLEELFTDTLKDIYFAEKRSFRGHDQIFSFFCTTILFSNYDLTRENIFYYSKQDEIH